MKIDTFAPKSPDLCKFRLLKAFFLPPYCHQHHLSIQQCIPFELCIHLLLLWYHLAHEKLVQTLSAFTCRKLLSERIHLHLLNREFDPDSFLSVDIYYNNIIIILPADYYYPWTFIIIYTHKRKYMLAKSKMSKQIFNNTQKNSRVIRRWKFDQSEV